MTVQQRAAQTPGHQGGSLSSATEAVLLKVGEFCKSQSMQTLKITSYYVALGFSFGQTVLQSSVKF